MEGQIMAVRQYVVTIDTPEGEDQFNYEVIITRHGKIVFESADPMIPARANIGAAIFRDMEEENDRPAPKVPATGPKVPAPDPLIRTEEIINTWTLPDWASFKDALDKHNAKKVKSSNTFQFRGLRWTEEYAAHLLSLRAGGGR
jgi:hypothetical protein